MKKFKKTDYLKNSFLLEQVKLSKEIQKNHPNRNAVECLTPELVNSIILLVEKYGQASNWRNYSYIEDMKAEATLSLCSVALKFDCDRYENVFGYYTQCITRTFITYMNGEKKQGHIRDDMIEMYVKELDPSFARQSSEMDNNLDGTKNIKSDPLLLRRAKRRAKQEYDT